MNPDNPFSPHDPPSSNLDEATLPFFRRAADAAQRGVWDEAISAYQSILKLDSANPRVRMALGKAYEGKSRGGDEKAFLVLAMEQYRQALRLDPQFMDANEALLSTAYRSGSLDDLITEYRLRYKAEPDNVLFRDFVKKAETLLSLPKKTAQPSNTSVGHISNILINWFLPAASALSILSAVTFMFMAKTRFSALMITSSLRSAIFFAFIYVVCRILISRA